MDDTVRLTDKRALVTGGSRGIGRGITGTLARRGADVGVNHLPIPEDENPLAELEKEVRELGRRFVALPGDVGVREEAIDVVDRAVRELGGLDVLVCNAGIVPLERFLSVTPELWERTLAVNLSGPFYMCQHAARHMIDEGGGSIVLITSYNAFLTAPRQTHYAASKAALDMLGKGMARELGPKGVRVNMVAPAAVVTDLSRRHWTAPSAREELEWFVPLARTGTPEDVGEAVAFLASDAAAFVNGASLAVDGGVMTSKR